MVAGSKKGKYGKDGSSSSVVSNGTVSLESRAKQPSAVREKSFDERKTAESNSKPVKVNHAKVKDDVIMDSDIYNLPFLLCFFGW